MLIETFAALRKYNFYDLLNIIEDAFPDSPPPSGKITKTYLFTETLEHDNFIIRTRRAYCFSGFFVSKMTGAAVPTNRDTSMMLVTPVSIATVRKGKSVG